VAAGGYFVQIIKYMKSKHDETIEEIQARTMHCTACKNVKFGIKTRYAVPHTCGIDSPMAIIRKASIYYGGKVAGLEENH